MKLAVIIARGGSRRIPKKNIKLFAGRPVIEYPITNALACGLFDQVIVSTDDEEIAGISRRAGARVPFMRPASLSEGHTTTIAVVQHAIRWQQDNDLAPDHVCCLYPPTPLLLPEHLKLGWDRLMATNANFAFAALRFSYPIQRALRKKGDFVELFNPEYANTRSQDFEVSYHDAAQFYWGSAKAFLEGASILGARATPVEIPREYAQDIDTPEDWTFAELLYQIRKNPPAGRNRAP